jgi:hypothetical protein
MGYMLQGFLEAVPRFWIPEDSELRVDPVAFAAFRCLSDAGPKLCAVGIKLVDEGVASPDDLAAALSKLLELAPDGTKWEGEIIARNGSDLVSYTAEGGRLYARFAKLVWGDRLPLEAT